ncbi:MAG: metallophosphoesterase [Acidobacteriota bacterium]
MIWKLAFGFVMSGAFHLYVWWRLAHGTYLPLRARRILGVVMVMMWCAIPITTSARLWAPAFASTIGWVTLPWLAFVGLASLALLVLELPRRALAPRGEAGLSRRQFLGRMAGGTAAVVGGTSVARGVLEARGDHEVVDVEVPLAKLPKALDGFTIVQLSDLHTGLTIDRAFVQRVVDHANRLSPDLIALTGDLVDGPVDALGDEVAPLGELRAKHGVFAITGNHEYYAGVNAWIAHISQLGIQYLRNARVAIGTGDATFDLAGVDDYSAARYDGHGEDLPRALAGRDRSRALVLLAHQPRQVKNAARYGVDLQLSGHTHGGQIWPWHYIARIQQGGLLAGRYEHRGTQLYVTRGCGYWGPPVRLLAPLEITRVILRAA